MMKESFTKYLANTEHIDWLHPLVADQAARLSEGCVTVEQIAQNCFMFVRDSIKHSWDHRMNPVTLKASDVLLSGTGYCYAKSHLLAALLRANGIPAGLCYQRLTVEPGEDRYCIHGLNAVYLADHGWYRIDARGNKPGVFAEFCPPVEKLAFSTDYQCERLLPEIFSEPLHAVLKVLSESKTVKQVYDNLPDIE